MKLVIVESPNKCHTIGNYLGKGYNVVASKGHIRDLATSGKGGFGVDIENDFAPKYIAADGKEALIAELIRNKNNATEVILATDPDREGEAIAWHLCQVLGLDETVTKRLEFHEITKDSITKAMQSPRVINMSLVNSQETRRIIDRIIGFKLSTLLKKKTDARSAGRVQSATLKLICDHENDIKNFKPDEYWVLNVEFKANGKSTKADYYQYKNEQFKLVSKDTNDVVRKAMTDSLIVKDIKKSQRITESKPPFTTSTLQQEAYNVCKFSTSETSRLAQELYEGVNIAGTHVGLITYIRTDSTLLSDTYVTSSLKYIEEHFGKQYVGKRKEGKKSKLAQEGHEAIRPTSNDRTPESVKQYLKPNQYKLYKLIYERALGSLMTSKVEEVTTNILSSGDVTFKNESSKTTFDGYTHIVKESSKTASVASFKVGDVYSIDKINNEQKFSEPPARYSEAKVVKLMEEKGIGRPSTYASTISLLKKREYVTSKGGVLTPTETGVKIVNILNKYFPDIIDEQYTASMENNLDDIVDGNESKSKVLTDFYYPFDEECKKAQELMWKDHPIETGENCPICGKPLIIKKGKYGEFISCSDFPKCNYVKKEETPVEYTGEMCPECGKPLIYKSAKRGKKFIGCSGYPECNYIKKEEKPKFEIKIVKPCPKCGGNLVEKRGPYSRFLGCTNYPTCTYQEKLGKKYYKK